MTASVFASVSEDRVADAKGIEALINKYLVAVKRCDVESLRSTFEPSANISHYYVKGDAIRVNDVEGFINVIKSLHAKYDKPRKWRKRSTFDWSAPLPAFVSRSASLWGRIRSKARTSSISPAARESGRSSTRATISECR
jgi:hypothetical protein